MMVEEEERERQPEKGRLKRRQETEGRSVEWCGKRLVGGGGNIQRRYKLLAKKSEGGGGGME